MRRQAVLTALVAVGSVWASAGAALAADARSAADLLPATSLVYVEAPRPGAAIDLVRNHPVVKRLREVEAIRDGVKKDAKLREFFEKVGELETALGRPLREAIGDLTEQGIYFAVEPASQGGVLLLRGRDPETVLKLRDELVAIAEREAKARGVESKLEESTYRGQTVFQQDEAYHAVLGEWFVITNKETLGRGIVDAYLDPDETTLADEPLFQEAFAGAPQNRAAWLYVRLDVLRLVGATKKIFADQLKDPGAELVAGGLVAALQKANYVTASLHLADDEIRLTASAPFNPAKVPEARSFYFGPGGSEQAPAPLNVPNRLMSLVLFRDAAKWWTTSEEEFPEEIAAKLAQADSQLTLFFSGKDFSTEILGKLEPQHQLVLARQDFSKLGDKAPDVKLPAGALVLKTKPDADLGRTIKIAFQSIAGLGNLAAGQEGRPQFELSSRTEDGVEYTAATYGPVEEADEKDARGIHRNFSPTLAVSAPWIVFSSTESLARDAIAALKKQSAGVPDNARLELDYAPLADALKDNREHLVHQNMLEKGHDREAADAEIDLLFQVVSLLRGASARITPADGKLTAELSVKFASE